MGKNLKIIQCDLDTLGRVGWQMFGRTQGWLWLATAGTQPSSISGSRQKSKSKTGGIEGWQHNSMNKKQELAPAHFSFPF